MKKKVEKNASTTTHQDDKKRRFRVVASRRVQKVLDSIENLQKCANRRNYDYSDDDVRKMLKVIGDKYNLLRVAFTTGVKKDKQTFEF